MALSRAREDREYNRFVECQGEPAVRTKICQDAGEVLRVDLIEDGEAGVPTNTFSQVTNVASGSPTTIVSYTVPVGKTFYLKKTVASGDNRAKYTVKIGGASQSIKRTWHSDFNVDLDWHNFAVAAGVTILIEVEHNRSATNEFDGNILGSLA